MVDIAALAAQLVTVSAMVKVIVDLIKVQIPIYSKINLSPNAKWLSSLIVSVAITTSLGISLFEDGSQSIMILGSVGAGLIAGLGSNFIHDFMKVLQTLKELKK